MATRIILLFAVTVALAGQTHAQRSIRDTSLFIVPITASYALQAPSGDMAERFGTNSNVALSVATKFKSNYLLGLEGGFMFGNNIREEGVLRGITGPSGIILDREGKEAEVLLFQRGYSIFAVAGKLMSVAGPNPNSGILLKLGVGYMRHKLRLESQNNEVPQLEGDYVQGYDRLAAGPAGMLFVGYQHLSNRRLINFMLGFEMQLGFTEPLRAFNFDTGRRESGTRFDGLTGLRVGWILPIYRQNDEAFYIY